MNTKNRSEVLNAHLDGIVNPEVWNNLENLRWLINPELFELFERRINEIISENQWSDEVIASELWKTTISAEKLLDWYTRTFRSVIEQAANDEYFWKNNDNLLAA